VREFTRDELDALLKREIQKLYYLMHMKISIIVSMSKNRVIGKDNKLPWHIPEDLQWFKRHTLNHSVIMGRKTYESIGKILPERENIIISKQKNYSAPGALLFNSLEDALSEMKRKEKDELFIIGGSRIFEDSLHLADRIYLTLIHREFEGDAYFPYFPDHEFKTIFEEKHGGSIPFTFFILERQ